MDKIYKYALLIVRDSRFLINRKCGTKLFLMPGGRPEEGETVEECFRRELMEEHGVEVNVDSLKLFGEFEDLAANEPNTIIHSTVYVGEVTGDPSPSSEIEEQRWFGKGHDTSILSSIIKNKIYPAILEKCLI